MLQSMTGFGKSQVSINGIQYALDIKSLNSKNIDLNVRLPHWMRSSELELRKIVIETLQRGKVDVFIHTEVIESDALTNLNLKVIKAYMNQMQGISHDLTVQDRFNAAMLLPDVMQSNQSDFSEEDWNEFKIALKVALNRIQEFRKDEGKILFKEFELRIGNIMSLLKEVPEYEEERIVKLKQRIYKSLEEFSEVNEERLEQELILYLEKLDITEEKLRLQNHCEYFIETLNSPESNGKKLNFISQEIGREINTLGSKSNHSEMQKIVVDMKDELEKIKEQLLNVL